jgi:hypothetical protein
MLPVRIVKSISRAQDAPEPGLSQGAMGKLRTIPQ